MLTEIIGRWKGLRKNNICTVEALSEFLDEQSAYISQSSAYSYCRARTGFMGPKLFDEKGFSEELEVCKWTTYLAVLEDMLIFLEMQLRPDGRGDQEKLHHALCGVHQSVLNRRPPPPRLEQLWLDAGKAFALRLAQSQMAAPKTADVVANHSGRVLYDNVPIHIDLKKLDEEMLVNSLRFRFLRFAEELEGALEKDPLVRELGVGG